MYQLKEDIKKYETSTATNGAVSAGNVPGATFGERAITSISEATTSTVGSTAAQSAVTGESFSEALKSQGLNIIAGAVGNLGAKEIGIRAHGVDVVNADGQIVGHIDGTINKAQQLALHAGLGAVEAGIVGNDPLSGAVSGVVGESVGEYVGENTDLSDSAVIQIGGLAGAGSAIFTGNAVGLSDSEVADNMWSGQRIGSNAVENNLLHSELLVDSQDGQQYGPRGEHPITGRQSFHNGSDNHTLSNDRNVHASADGTSLGTYYQYNEEAGTGWGNYVVVEHTDDEGNRYMTRYAHLEELPDIPSGTPIREGQPIGIMGNTGGSSGAHLHYEVQIYNPQTGGWNYINPASINLGNYEHLEDVPNYD